MNMVNLPMHAHEGVRGHCWVSPPITLLYFILRVFLGVSRVHQLARLVSVSLGYLPVCTHSSRSGVTDIHKCSLLLQGC